MTIRNFLLLILFVHAFLLEQAYAHPQPQTFFGEEVIACDFNNDGADDLAVGAPLEDVGGSVNAGAVHVVYGSNPDGLQSSTPPRQLWHHDNLGMASYATPGFAFGGALGVGDFNNDGYCDLAVGAPGHSMIGYTKSGAVNILYGTSDGLRSTSIPGIPSTMFNGQLFNQNTGDIPDVVESWDGFGASLAGGDFNNDGYDDLAIGVPGEDFNAKENTGYVNVIYGSAAGLQTTSPVAWGFFQHTFGVPFDNEPQDHMGESLAAGDFNNDGYDDLAIGVPGEDDDAGLVKIINGGQLGLRPMLYGEYSFRQGFGGINGANEADDHFGEYLAVGNFNGDNYADLAVGAPGEDIGTISNAGAVNVIYGSNTGLTGTGDQIWHQNTTHIGGSSEAGDLFGDSLATGDFDSDGYDDLAIGVFGESVGSIAEAGIVNVIYGSATKLTAVGNQLWHQNSSGIEDMAEAGDHFAFNLTAGDFDNDGYADLAVGVPDEDITEEGETFVNAGMVNVIYGSSDNLSADGDQAVIGDDIINSTLLWIRNKFTR